MSGVHVPLSYPELDFLEALLHEYVVDPDRVVNGVRLAEAILDRLEELRK